VKQSYSSQAPLPTQCSFKVMLIIEDPNEKQVNFQWNDDEARFVLDKLA
jgi:hypothetical protein